MTEAMRSTRGRLLRWGRARDNEWAQLALELGGIEAGAGREPVARLDGNFPPTLPDIETPGRRVVGTSVASARKRVFQVFTAEEIGRILEQLPAYTSVPRAKVP